MMTFAIAPPWARNATHPMRATAQPVVSQSTHLQIILGASTRSASCPATSRRHRAPPRERQGRGRIYVVEPTGAFEDDPNVTNKKFPGNVTRSFRTLHPMRIIDEVKAWDGHPPEVLQAMLDNLTQLRDQGRDLIED
jgi:Rifampin ADP-ribosyl transferase